VKKHVAAIRRYNNGSTDKTFGPAGPEHFPGGEHDQRYKKQQFLDPDGLCQVGEILESGHVLVNKFSPANQSDLVTDTTTGQAAAQEYKPSKITYKGATVSTVDKVVVTSNENENFIVKVSH
jgi:DNA-directed RNA polymerase III subunit RPC2